MILVTPAAAEQIHNAAKNGNMEGLALRIAVREKSDGGFDYGIGFDEVKDDDMVFESNGIEVIMAPQFGPMLKGAAIDYVEMAQGDFRFIVLNPNDPNYTPPQES